MTAADIDVGRIVERYAAGENEAHAAIRSTGEVVRAVLDQLGPGPKVRRERVDLDHVNALVESGGASWPPIVVTGVTGTVIDGHHRAAAARRLGWSTIPAVVVDVDHRSVEGLAAATKANIEHGLSLSVPERKTIAGRLIAETDWSDNRIGDVCGLNRKTVAKLRPRNMPTEDWLRGSVGRDGKVRPSAAEAAERREAAARELTEKPTTSDREVAMRTGLSPRTVADVRRRNEAGESPTPPRLRAVPDPEPGKPVEDEAPKVTVGDVLPSVPTDWLRHPAAGRTNETRSFMRFLNRWGRVSAFQKDRQKHLRMCPPDARDEAVRNARWMARQWEAFACELERLPAMEVTE